MKGKGLEDCKPYTKVSQVSLEYSWVLLKELEDQEGLAGESARVKLM